MICNKCGSELEEGALFCTNCGARVEEQTDAENAKAAAAIIEEPVARESGGEGGKSVSLGTWICRYLINLIPCVGGLVFVVMLFVWSADKKYDETSRNWAKANLIFIGIALIAATVITLIVGGFAAVESLRYAPRHSNGILFDMIY